MDFAVREATLGDIDSLVELRMTALHDVYGVYRGFVDERHWEGLREATERLYRSDIPAGRHIACIASCNGEDVACGGICIHGELPSPENYSGLACYIMNVYTLPGYRKQGIGREVLRWLVSRSRSLGADKIYLETSPAARRLYEDEGFTDMKGYMRLPGEYMEWRRKLGIERLFFYASDNRVTMDFKPSEFMAQVRSKHPLVHHITNYVTVNDCANMCICSGGSPVMTDAAEDVPEMVSLANAVVLNIGTLNDRTVESMLLAGKTANEEGIPVILDPVGVGATAYRTLAASKILEKVDVAVIKGNHGEMGVLSGMGGKVRGVDSAGSSADQRSVVEGIAKRWNCIAASTGKTDYVSDGETSYRLSNGSSRMGYVSGTGCMLSSVIGSYVGACGASVGSVCSAISALNVASEMAEYDSDGPGTFKPVLLDHLYNLGPDFLDTRSRIERIRSEHLQLAGYPVQLRIGCRPDAHAGLGAGFDLGAPRIGYEGDVEAVAGRQLEVLVQLLLVLHPEDHLLLPGGHPGVEGPLVLLLREESAFDRGVAHLGGYLALAHLQVLPDEDDQLVLLLRSCGETECHAPNYRCVRYNRIGAPGCRIRPCTAPRNSSRGCAGGRRLCRTS